MLESNSCIAYGQSTPFFKTPTFGRFFILFTIGLFTVSASFSAQAQGGISKVGDVVVYDNYADLAPIFEQETDTVYVINFWATWCKPCVEELPYFEKLHTDYQGEKVKVVLVSLDFPRHLETKLLPFIKDRKLQSEVVVLTDVRQNEWIDKVDPKWSGTIPVTVIYRGEKRRFIDKQFANYEELEGIVRSLY